MKNTPQILHYPVRPETDARGHARMPLHQSPQQPRDEPLPGRLPVPGPWQLTVFPVLLQFL